MSSAEIATNTVLLGKYRVEHELGRGGWGVVVQARHLVLGEVVAIKLLTAAEIDEESRARFVREARAAAKLRSDHVVRVTDVGEDDGLPYMVMELLEGWDLHTLIKERPIEPTLLCTLVVQVCSALAEAHSLGIVHRDIKSSNLFVTTRNGAAHAKVLDFGIAKAPEAIDFSLTRTSSILGTPAFMSPEQLRSAHRVDERTDIWSLGVVLFEGLEGELPFVADSFSELVLKIGIDPTPPMRNAPPGLEPIIQRCLEKDPAKRYQTVGEVAAALAPWATSSAAMIQRIQSGALSRVRTDPSTPVATPAITAPPTQVDRRRRWPIVLGVVGFLVAGGIVFAVARHGSDDAEPKTVEKPRATNAGEAADPKAAGSAKAKTDAPKPPDPKPPDPKPPDPPPTDLKPTRPDPKPILPKPDPKPIRPKPDLKPDPKPDPKPNAGSATVKKPCDVFTNISGDCQ